MKLFKIKITIVTVAALLLMGSGPALGRIPTGQTVADFTLKDLNGNRHHLADLNAKPMVILYFFDVKSQPSQEGLTSLGQLIRKHRDADLVVWGITRSPQDKVREFVRRAGIQFPILLDDAKVSERYQARYVLPTICTIGPERKAIDFMQGGGKTTEIMLTRLAERNLSRKKYTLAKAISEQVSAKDPANAEAKAVKGYAELREGRLEEAEQTFSAMSSAKGQAEVLGKEGLSRVYAKQGKTDAALALADEVEQKAPERGFANVVKGDILYQENKKQAAAAEYRKAVKKESGATYQKAIAYNQLGRIQSDLGDLKEARKSYGQATDIDPYYIEATSNTGITLEKEGKWDEALEAYRQTLVLKKDDLYAAVLAKRAESMLALENDTEKRKRMDSLIKNLSARFREQQKADARIKADEWTSRPMVLTFIDFQEKGGLPERDGFATVLATQLSEQLNLSGRMQVVERILVERLLDELNLGSSDLADPGTALKLGKVLAARIIGTGSLFFMPGSTLVSLRLIDTETTAISKVMTRHIEVGQSLEKELFRINREILETITVKYPLQGFVVEAENDEVIVNLGSRQGVVKGTRFDVLKEQPPIEYKGKVLHKAPKSIALVEVVRIEPDFCYAKILKKDAQIQRDDKVKEKPTEI